MFQESKNIRNEKCCMNLRVEKLMNIGKKFSRRNVGKNCSMLSPKQKIYVATRQIILHTFLLKIYFEFEIASKMKKRTGIESKTDKR